MKKIKGKTFVKLLCFIFIVMFGSIASEVFATCPDGSGNCNISLGHEFQIDNKRALTMSESYSEIMGGTLLRDIFIGENAGAALDGYPNAGSVLLMVIFL